MANFENIQDELFHNCMQFEDETTECRNQFDFVDVSCIGLLDTDNGFRNQKPVTALVWIDK